MKCVIKAESAGRIRVHAAVGRMTMEMADILEYYLRELGSVEKVKVFERTADAIICYSGTRQEIIDALVRFDFDDENISVTVPSHTSRALNSEYSQKLFTMVSGRVLKRMLLPYPIRAAIAAVKAVKFVVHGLKSLVRGKVDVAVLDATAITVSLIRGDAKTASSIMFLLGLGGLLEDWAHKKSIDDLAGMMSLDIDRVWKKDGDTEVLVPIEEISKGDEVIVHAGHMIPLDGSVSDGEAMVNQASMTGESMPVRKTEGSYVYSGTVLEEGIITIRVDKTTGSGRFDRIVRMIEESEKLNSETEDKAVSLADRLVPASLIGTVVTYALTGNANRALSFLMVDYSCALKLAIPLTVLAAIRNCSKSDIVVKGGKYLERVAKADTIIFDKTGTLTKATPKVVEVIPFNGEDADEMLRYAACLEEHYPHPIANAVVEEAKLKGLSHEEMHTRVDYVVAHGISSTIDGTKVSLGSYHYIFQDEEATVNAGEDTDRFNSLTKEYSHLYLAIGGVLSAVICIADPLKDEAIDVVRKLKEAGFTNVAMMTGDNRDTAEAIASKLDLDTFMAEMLPEGKAAYVREQTEKGHGVIMIGDGVNDTLALSEADVGVAVTSGAAIAKEISDITIESDDLDSLLVLRENAEKLMKRIDRNYKTILSFNSVLIIAGALGLIQPTASAMAHNISTLLISLDSMKFD